MTDLPDREERSRAGGGEKGDLEDLQCSQEQVGMLGGVSGATQSPAGPRGGWEGRGGPYPGNGDREMK